VASIGNPFFIKGAKVSGTFKSDKIIEESSNVRIIELSETSTSSDKPLSPKTPSNGAIIFSVFNLAKDLLLGFLLLLLKITIFHKG